MGAWGRTPTGSPPNAARPDAARRTWISKIVPKRPRPQVFCLRPRGDLSLLMACYARGRVDAVIVVTVASDGRFVNLLDEQIPPVAFGERLGPRRISL